MHWRFFSWSSIKIQLNYPHPVLTWSYFTQFARVIATRSTQSRANTKSKSSPNRTLGSLYFRAEQDRCLLFHPFSGHKGTVGASYTMSKNGKSSLGGAICYDRSVKRHRLLRSKLWQRRLVKFLSNSFVSWPTRNRNILLYLSWQSLQSFFHINLTTIRMFYSFRTCRNPFDCGANPLILFWRFSYLSPSLTEMNWSLHSAKPPNLFIEWYLTLPLTIIGMKKVPGNQGRYSSI